MILKGDLKSFQENFKTFFFKSVCHDLTLVNLRAHRDKSHAHFLTNNSSGCQHANKFKLNDSAMMKSSMKKVKGSKGTYFPKTAD